MNKQHTSIHRLNADYGLKKHQMCYYLFLNILNNSLPNFKVDKKIKVQNFSVDNLDKYWLKLDAKNSAFRKLIDLFLIVLPWTNLKNELGEINIFDVGCGSGEYGKLLLQWSNNIINTYYGCDINKSKNWEILEDQHSSFYFLQSSSDKIENIIPNNINFFITISAIEHFDKDLLYFSQIKNFILKHNRPTIHIHFFPSASCLWLFLLQGVRRYTPRKISHISKLFNNFSYIYLFKLGGKYCYKVHWNYVTKPLYFRHSSDLREVKTKEYDKNSKQVILKDMHESNNKPSFYALVIHSLPKNRIFH